MKNLKIIFLVMILSIGVSYASDDTPNGTSNQENLSAPEGNALNQKTEDISYRVQLETQLKEAIESGNTQQELSIRKKLHDVIKNQITIPNSEDRDYPVFEGNPPFTPDWMINDILIYDGDIGQVGSDHDRIDLKMGEDGWLYAALIRRPIAGTNGRIDFYRSNNGGLNWTFVGGVQSATAYFGQVSITVEARDDAILDSTRVIIFYSRSTDENFNGATINWASFRRNGTAFMGGVSALTPTAGNKLLFPSALSDGQYWAGATWFGVTCGEYNNAGTQCVSLRFARTQDWGLAYSTSTIVDGYPTWSDWFPKASFKKGTSLATDSIYIAVERRFTASPSIIRVIATPWSPSSSFFRHNVLASSPDNYRKPSMTIVQDAASLPKIILIGAIREGVAIYHRSSNGGSSWVTNSTFSLGTENNVSYVSVSSDSNKADGGYIIGTFQKGNGDTLVVRRGIPGSLGTRVVKPNEFQSSPFNSPKVAIYTSNNVKYSALLYTGLSAGNYTSNVYFDQENLPTDIQNTGINIAGDYKLDQNYPNPFNPETNISFSIPVSGLVKIVVYDMLGKEVASLVNGELQSGNYIVNFDATGLTSGVYFYKLTSGDYSDIKKMMLIK